MEPRLTEQIPRRGRGTTPPEHEDGTAQDPGPAAWSEIVARLLTGEATTWLSVPTATGVHTRPLFSAWTGSSFVFTTKSTAAKTRHLDAFDEADRGAPVSLAIHLGTAHVVVEGTAQRMTAHADLEAAAAAMREVYDWPATVTGDELDAPYGAPTSGGPPFRAYEIVPARAFAFPTDDRFEPTRFTW